jgi:hypothetical protein
MNEPVEQPKLEDYWEAFVTTARPTLQESMGEPLFNVLGDHLEQALHTAFYCGSEAVICALINHQENVGPDITAPFNALADESAAFLALHHRQPQGDDNAHD